MSPLEIFVSSAFILSSPNHFQGACLLRGGQWLLFSTVAAAAAGSLISPHDYGLSASPCCFFLHFSSHGEDLETIANNLIYLLQIDLNGYSVRGDLLDGLELVLGGKSRRRRRRRRNCIDLWAWIKVLLEITSNTKPPLVLSQNLHELIGKAITSYLYVVNVPFRNAHHQRIPT